MRSTSIDPFTFVGFSEVEVIIVWVKLYSGDVNYIKYHFCVPFDPIAKYIIHYSICMTFQKRENIESLITAIRIEREIKF